MFKDTDNKNNDVINRYELIRDLNIYSLLQDTSSLEYYGEKYAVRGKLVSKPIDRPPFLLKNHQIIPKLFFESNPNLKSILLLYQMGAGKTITAINMILDKIHTTYVSKNNITEIAPQYKIKHFKSIIIIGEWNTQNQFEKDLIRPEFTLVKPNIYNEIIALSTTKEPAKRKRYEELYTIAINNATSQIRFFGYQSFFNHLFPTYARNDGVQTSISKLRDEYNKGTLEINKQFIEMLNETTIIVDETQRLYNAQDMNTYGFAVMIANKFTTKTTRFIFLSGTILNSNISEIVSIYNIMNSDSKKLVSLNEICDEKVDSNNVFDKYMIKKSFYPNIHSLFGNNTLFYGNTDIESNEYLNNERFIKIRQIDQLGILKYQDLTTVKDLYAIEIFRKQFHPQEYLIGNSLVTASNESALIAIDNKSSNDVNMCVMLTNVELEGNQAKAYIDYITRVTQQNDDEDNGDEEYVSYTPRDGVTRSEDMMEYNKNGDVVGDNLLIPNLKKFSALHAAACEICLYNAVRNEKTIVYNNRLKNFGARQFLEVLTHNGCLKVGEVPDKRCICKVCGHSIVEHQTITEFRNGDFMTFVNNWYDEKIFESSKKQIKQHPFEPIYCAMIYGGTSNVERRNIVDGIYNNKLNKIGRALSILIITDIASTGVSFYTTQNMIIMNRIYNIAKYKQIANRISRTNSHDELEASKRYCKLFTLAAYVKNESSYLPPNPYLNDHNKNDSSYIDSFEARYYKSRLRAAYEISSLLRDIHKHSRIQRIIDQPESYAFSDDEEHWLLCKSYIHDIEVNLKNVVRFIMQDEVSKFWTINKLIERITNTNYNTRVCALNLSQIPPIIIKQLLGNIDIVGFVRVADTTDSKNKKVVEKNLALRPLKIENDEDKILNDERNVFVMRKDISEFVNDENIIKGVIGLDDLKDNVEMYNTEDKLLENLFRSNTMSGKRNAMFKILRSFVCRHQNGDVNIFKGLTNNEAFWDEVYNLHNEWYEDDEENFIYNHAIENRNREKLAGVYYGNKVILKNGDVRLMVYKEVDVTTNENIPYIFGIRTGRTVSINNFYIHLLVTDLRGTNLFSKKGESKSGNGNDVKNKDKSGKGKNRIDNIKGVKTNDDTSNDTKSNDTSTKDVETTDVKTNNISNDKLMQQAIENVSMFTGGKRHPGDLPNDAIKANNDRKKKFYMINCLHCDIDDFTNYYPYINVERKVYTCNELMSIICSHQLSCIDMCKYILTPYERLSSIKGIDWSTAGQDED